MTRGRGANRWGGNAERAASSEVNSYKSPTTGLEKILFDCDSHKAAATFEDTRRELSTHVGTMSWLGAGAASMTIETMIEPVFEVPTKPEKGADEVEYKGEMELFYEKRRDLNKKKSAWEGNGPRCYNLMLQHCPPKVKNRLAARPNWETVCSSRSLVGILELLRDVSRNHDESKNGLMEVVEADTDLYLGYQERNQNLDDFFKVFKATHDTILSLGGTPGYHKKMEEDAIAAALATLTDSQRQLDTLVLEPIREELIAKATQDQRSEYLALLFLKQVSNYKYGGLKQKLGNDNLGSDNDDVYPKTVDAMLRYLKNYKGAEGQRGQPRQQNGVALEHHQDGDVVYTCFGCGSTDHVLKKCTKVTKPQKNLIFEGLHNKAR